MNFILILKMRVLHESETYISEFMQLIHLTLPLMLSVLIEASGGFLTTFLVAKLGYISLAASAIAVTLFVSINILFGNILGSISIIISRLRGEGNNAQAIQTLIGGLVLAIIFSFISMLIFYTIQEIVSEVIPNFLFYKQISGYLNAVVWSNLPTYCSIVILQFLIAYKQMRYTIIYSSVYVISCFSIAYTLMFGGLGFQPRDLTGLGLGISFASWMAFITLIIMLLFSKNMSKRLPKLRSIYSTGINCFGSILFKILKLGSPIGIIYSVEVMFFVLMSILMGRVNSQALAGSQIVIQYCSFINILLLFCLAEAISVRVAYYVGNDNFQRAKIVSYLGVFISVVFILIPISTFIIYPDFLISLDLKINSDNEVVVNYARHFFNIAVFYEVFQAMRMAAYSVLRGIGVVQYTMIITLIIFGFIAPLLVCALSINNIINDDGFWWIGVLSVLMCSLTLMYKFYQVFQNKFNLLTD